jgi:hypothetical protein
MKPTVKCVVIGLATLLYWGIVLPSLPAFGAFMYKKYAVKYDKGHDILCEPYVVEKNDWILKVFKRKGEIAYQDFRAFLRIFKRVNPHVKNVNQIRPGQYVLIPLRRIPLDSLPGQSTGTVTIPFVTLSKFPESASNQLGDYIVNKGDTVSALVSRQFGAYGTVEYLRGINRFRELNPEVVDLNLIYTGQKIILPSRDFKRLQQTAGASGRPAPMNDPNAAEAILAKDSSLRYIEKKTASSMRKAASVLGAKLLDSGVYYFPGRTGSDSELDLSKFPVLVFNDGTRILFRGEKSYDPEVTKSAESFWKNLQFADISPKNSTEKIVSSVMDLLKIKSDHKALQFNDRGVSVTVKAKWMIDTSPKGTDKTQRLCVTVIDHVQERTPRSIVRYLEQHGIVLREVVRGDAEPDPSPGGKAFVAIEEKAITLPDDNPKLFVRSFMNAIGYKYTRGVTITFPYAGVQVKAVTDLISTRDGTPVFVDFGDLYGEAVDAILKTGFGIVQILPEDDLLGAVPKLLDAVGASFVHNPTLHAAIRNSKYNTSLTLPGYMVEKFGRPTVLLTNISLPVEILHFLIEKEIIPVAIDRIAS